MRALAEVWVTSRRVSGQRLEVWGTSEICFRGVGLGFLLSERCWLSVIRV